MKDIYDLCVIGGAGHVGLPLSIAFANEGLSVCIYDINKSVINKLQNGFMPFLENGAEPLLKKTLGKTLFLSDKADVIAQSKYVILIIGTPIDEHLNPNFSLFKKLLNEYLKFFRDNQIVILRSTVYPGTSQMLQEFFRQHKLNIHVSFCPERIAEGKAMEELYSLPQIISGFDDYTVNKVRALFSHLTKEFVVLSPIEAELAKLFTNAWRYIQFAISNQFYMIAEDYSVNFYKILRAIKYKYPRAQGFPKAGFSAGPCLFKDTMQIAAFSDNNFFLGHAAMLVNEGLPNFIVGRLKAKYNLKKKVIGILGMAFKGNSDDTRESLAYKLKKLLEVEAKAVMCSDEYVKRDNFYAKETVLKKADIIIIGAPHNTYKDIKTKKTIIDIWDFVRSKESIE